MIFCWLGWLAGLLGHLIDDWAQSPTENATHVSHFVQMRLLLKFHFSPLQLLATSVHYVRIQFNSDRESCLHCSRVAKFPSFPCFPWPCQLSVSASTPVIPCFTPLITALISEILVATMRQRPRPIPCT